MISWAIQILPTSRDFAQEVCDKKHGGIDKLSDPKLLLREQTELIRRELTHQSKQQQQQLLAKPLCKPVGMPHW